MVAPSSSSPICDLTSSLMDLVDTIDRMSSPLSPIFGIKTKPNTSVRDFSCARLAFLNTGPLSVELDVSALAVGVLVCDNIGDFVFNINYAMVISFDAQISAEVGLGCERAQDVRQYASISATDNSDLYWTAASPGL